MKVLRYRQLCHLVLIIGALLFCSGAVWGQLIDQTLAPNAANAGIAKSYEEQIGAGRGDIFTPNSSLFLIARDPFRSIRRGRQLFQRKFTRFQGQGPAIGDGTGNVEENLAIGAGLTDSCAACHGRPRGAAGFGGDVVTRPDSRDSPHLFGIGLKEMLGDEMTADLRAIRDRAIFEARLPGWRSYTYYKQGAQVLYNGIAYEALKDNRSSYWSNPSRAHDIWARPLPAGTADWTAWTMYKAGISAIYNDTIYECTQDHISNSSSTPATAPDKWTPTEDELASDEPLPGSGKIIKRLITKGVDFGRIIVSSSYYGEPVVDTSQVRGVNPDLRVRPFFLHGALFAIREFVVAGAFEPEMGLQPYDPDLLRASAGERVVTPSGMVLDGSKDVIARPILQNEFDDPDNDGVINEVPTSIVDHVEYYLLNYFKAAVDEITPAAVAGRQSFIDMGCAVCHKPNLTINRDRRPADLETNFDPVRGISFNRLFGEAVPQFVEEDDGSGFATIKTPVFGKFVVRNIFTDLKRHDLGPNFWEIEYDGTLRKEFLTKPLWGVGTTGPYGHDGRSMNLRNVILRHGGEAAGASSLFRDADTTTQNNVILFLETLVIFPPDDTPSNLDPGDVNTPDFPQFGHGSFRLVELFNDPTDPE